MISVMTRSETILVCGCSTKLSKNDFASASAIAFTSAILSPATLTFLASGLSLEPEQVAHFRMLINFANSSFTASSLVSSKRRLKFLMTPSKLCRSILISLSLMR